MQDCCRRRYVPRLCQCAGCAAACREVPGFWEAVYTTYAELRGDSGAPRFVNKPTEVLMDPPAVLTISIVNKVGSMPIICKTLKGEMRTMMVLPDT